jgi:anti-sigma regulatory factor (Ser/Thr protein kinase)
MSSPASVSLVLAELLDLANWRSLVRQVATAQGLPEQLLEAAALVASELGTNALVHGKAPVHAAVEPYQNGVCIRVEDASHHHPDLDAEMPEPCAVGGRGMPIVLALAASIEVLHRPDGKTVIAHITTR